MNVLLVCTTPSKSSMADNLYEVIVIGAGVEGSVTGYYLTSRGTKNVLMLEQVRSTL